MPFDKFILGVIALYLLAVVVDAIMAVNETKQAQKNVGPIQYPEHLKVLKLDLTVYSVLLCLVLFVIMLLW